MRLAAIVLALAACGDNADKPLSIIVDHKQGDWDHPSNPVAVQALTDLANANGWKIQVTDDPAFFRPETIRDVDVVVFSVTSGDILDDESRATLHTFFTNGGGFVGIHSPSHTEWDWPFYMAKVVPVIFKTHPYPMNLLSGQVDVVDTADPVVGALPNPWTMTDEFYTFYERPEDIDGLHILLALDESRVENYPDDVKVGYHPITFSHELDGGRAFYTALGHPPEQYADPTFMGMIERAIVWTSGARDGK